MRSFLLFLILTPFIGSAQSVKKCKQRFDSYLNFRGSLNSLVKFDNNSICIYHNGKKEFSLYTNELEMMAEFFEHTSLKQQTELLQQKGNKNYNKRQRDSLWIYVDDRKKLPKKRKGLPLEGYRVAIDPGHFSVSLDEGEIEGKYLYFALDSIRNGKDSVRIFESELSFLTAQILRKMLEEQGAKVFLTKNESNFTSFNCTYSSWFDKRKNATLDSLVEVGFLTVEKKNRLLALDRKRFFWEFFRDYDLLNRAKIINTFNPHVSAVIHYNVDEKNEPWKKTTKKNVTMSFIGGAFTADNFEKTETRINFLRLLLTNQLNSSEKISAQVTNQFSKLLQIPIAKPEDALYLKNNSMTLPSPGVYSRNLVMCRQINSPVVYGEALYQDNEKECIELMKRDIDKYGIRVNSRVVKCANAYMNGIAKFLKEL
ncbi:MAG: N-acetylmuramoyl-L-alanine amidase [Sphingobacteriaceae bacterium]|nr:N-acetylmuramoyl-L-alanine amidase [Sphingobacteriaceae bacterium]